MVAGQRQLLFPRLGPGADVGLVPEATVPTVDATALASSSSAVSSR
jgi:hypothetical protein